MGDLALAVWFMDDGGPGSNTRFGLVIDVTGFTEDEPVFLRDKIFKDVYDLKTSIQKHGNKVAKIYRRRESGNDFYNIVNLFVAPSMVWKLSAKL